MRINILILIAVFATGCSGSPDNQANSLFVESVQLVQKAQVASSPAEAIKNYETALENISRIIDQYPGSEIAVKLISGETLFSGESVNDIRSKIESLSDEIASYEASYVEGIKKLQAMLDPRLDEKGEPIIKDGKIMRVGDVDEDGYVTQEDVHKAMGREPKSTVTEDETTVIETYTWPRSIPSMTYDAYAVYYKSADKTTLKEVTESKPEIKKPETKKDRPAGLTRAGNPAADKAAKDKADKDKADKEKADKE